MNYSAKIDMSSKSSKIVAKRRKRIFWMTFQLPLSFWWMHKQNLIIVIHKVGDLNKRSFCCTRDRLTFGAVAQKLHWVEKFAEIEAHNVLEPKSDGLTGNGLSLSLEVAISECWASRLSVRNRIRNSIVKIIFNCSALLPLLSSLRSLTSTTCVASDGRQF